MSTLIKRFLLSFVAVFVLSEKGQFDTFLLHNDSSVETILGDWCNIIKWQIVGVSLGRNESAFLLSKRDQNL